MNHPANQTSAIQIIIGPYGLAEVAASCEPIIRDVLSYEQIDFESENGRLSYQRGRWVAYQQANASTLVFPVGCLQRVCSALRKAGHHCEIHDRRGLDRESLRVDRTDIDQAERACRGITACLERHTEGLLQIARGRPRARAIGAICRLLPRARIFVAGSSRQIIQETVAELGHFLGGEVEAVCGGNWSSGCRVVCGSFISYDRAQASDWHVLIFEDGREALNLTTRHNRGAFGRHRVYAFVEPGGHLTQKEQLELEVLAGPIIQSPQGKKRRSDLTLEVVFAATPEEYLPPAETPRERRERLWTAPRRNAAVAAVAEALATRNPAALWSQGLFLHEDDPFRRWPQPPCVTLLVESVQHADALADRLPGWTRLDRRARHSDASRLNVGWSRWAVPHRSIITAVRAVEFKCFDANVILSAAGGSFPQLPAGLARRGGHVLVVDIDDKGDRYLTQDTERRRRGYDKILQAEVVS